MDTNMKALLCVQTLENAVKAAPDIRGVSIHSDRGSIPARFTEMQSANMVKGKV